FHDASLVSFLQGVLDRLLEPGRLVHHDEVARRRSSLLQERRDLNREEENGRKQKNADPETFRLRVLDVFAPRHQKCVSHRNPASLASGPTRCTNTSCKLGSDWLKLRKRMPFSKQACRIPCGSALSRICSSQ